MSNVSGLYLWTISWESATNRPEDRMVNTFHFRNLGPATDYDNVRDIIQNFYTADNPFNNNAIKDYFALGMLTGAFTIQCYALTDPKPRAPKYLSSGSTVIGSSSGLPAEVALVFSFQAEAESGELQRRRRNRVYLGGFSSNVNDDGVPVGELVETMLFSGRQMLLEAQASSSWEWVVYSPTDDAIHTVSNGWVDNAWDTQRRRGKIPTARGIFNYTSPE